MQTIHYPKGYKQMKCKNCGHREVYHKIGNKGQCMFVLEAGGKIISECDCEQFITQEEVLNVNPEYNKNNKMYETTIKLNPLKEVLKTETFSRAVEGTTLENKGCGKVLYYSFSNPVKCQKDRLCPSCLQPSGCSPKKYPNPYSFKDSNNSSETRNYGESPETEEVGKDKDPSEKSGGFS